MNRLKQLRMSYKLTVRELADKVNINYATISRMENGMQNFTDEYLTILADFFGVSSDYLLGRSENRNPDRDVSRQESLDDILQREMEGVEYALFGEVKDLTDEQKEDLLTMVKILKKQNKEG